MDQFDICTLRERRETFVVILQSDIIAEQNTRIVAPLLAVGTLPRLERLNPVIEIEGKPFILLVDQLLSIPSKVIDRKIGSAAGQRDAIALALDYLFKGF